MIKRCLAIGLFSFFSVSQAFIYHAKVLRRFDEQQNRYQYVIGLGDFHDRLHEANAGQRAAIYAALAQANPSNLKVIVEDLSTPNTKGCFNCGKFFLVAKAGILSGFAKEAQALGCSVANIEYRFCRVITLSPLMECGSPQSSVVALPASCDAKVAVLAQEINDALREISTYDDGPGLNSFYAKVQQVVHASCRDLDFNGAQEQSVVDYVRSTGKHEQVGALSHLFTFDSGLFDAKLAHEIVHSADKQVVVVLAGGTHIQVVSDLLEKNGYTTVYNASSGMTKEYDIRNCIGSTVQEGGYCLKPQPIAVDFLADYIQK